MLSLILRLAVSIICYLVVSENVDYIFQVLTPEPTDTSSELHQMWKSNEVEQLKNNVFLGIIVVLSAIIIYWLCK